MSGEKPSISKANSEPPKTLDGLKVDSVSFNPGATVFLPPTAIVMNEFPDLDQAFGATQKKKKGPTKEEIEAQKKAANDLLSTRGKP